MLYSSSLVGIRNIGNPTWFLETGQPKIAQFAPGMSMFIPEQIQLDYDNMRCLQFDAP